MERTPMVEKKSSEQPVPLVVLLWLASRLSKLASEADQSCGPPPMLGVCVRSKAAKRNLPVSVLLLRSDAA